MDKQKLINQFALVIKKNKLTAEEFDYITKHARLKAGVVRRKKAKMLPKVMPKPVFDKFFSFVSEKAKPQHNLMIKLMVFTGIRVNELVNIKIGDVHLSEKKIFIKKGKGGKERYVPIPHQLHDLLTFFCNSKNSDAPLFTNYRHDQMSTRAVQLFFKKYREQAQISFDVTPHTLRHQALTNLTGKGMTASQIKVISGHASNKALEIYQDVSLEAVQGKYQDSVKDFL